MKLFLGFYNKSVILTYIGGAAAVAGMALAMLGYMKYAILCLIICGIADVFDGTIARRCKRSEDEKEFGIQIDSLTDMVNFAVFPVVISFALGNTSWYHILACALYVIAAITRLGYFNVVTAHSAGEKVYTGLPVTFSSPITVLAYVVGRLLGITEILVFACICLMAFFFVLKFKLKKPGKIVYIIGGILTVAVIAAVIIFG